jgi:hypothetical protein
MIISVVYFFLLLCLLLLLLLFHHHHHSHFHRLTIITIYYCYKLMLIPQNCFYCLFMQYPQSVSLCSQGRRIVSIEGRNLKVGEFLNQYFVRIP